MTRISLREAKEMADAEIRLRPFREDDLQHLERYSTDPSLSEPFLWFGFRDPGHFRQRWQQDRFLDSDPRLLLVAASSDDSAMGWVSWRVDERLTSSGTAEIGALLFPEHRGHGVGTAAERMLVEYLFAAGPIHKLWAGTETSNQAEQKALERCGFVREAVLRQDHFRDGAWRDSVIYGLLRSDPTG